MELHFAYLQSGPVSIEVQRWFSLQCIVPKIFTINLEQDFADFKFKTPRNQALYLNVNIFGTMHRKLNHLWTSIDTGPLCKYAKCSSIYCTIKKIQRFEDRVIWRVYGRFSRAITPFFSPGKGHHDVVQTLLGAGAGVNIALSNVSDV